jgi:hypothetical protein
MADIRKWHSKAKKPLDRFSKKRGRGRPGVRAKEILGRANNYRVMFRQIITGPEAPLLLAKSEPEVVEAFASWSGYQNQFAPIAKLILKVMKEPKFPKMPDAQGNFLADSLAARGEITPRSSRDLCERQRAKEGAATHIIRWEFYIECSCGYKGRSHDHSCPKCDAVIAFGLIPSLNPIF